MMDSLQVQKLIDGELSSQEQRFLLSQIEDEGRWREIALAFVEDQQFRSAIQSRHTAASNMGSKVPATDSEPNVNRSRTGGVSTGHKWGPWLAVAAALVLTSAMGFQLGRSNSSPIEPSLAQQRDVADPPEIVGSNGNGVSVAQRDATPADLRNSPGEYLDAYGNRGIPVVDYQEGSQFLNEPLVTDAARDRLRDSGYNVNEGVRYISGRLNDGRQFVLPVRSVQFSPGQ